jgi:hypothetical protein
MNKVLSLQQETVSKEVQSNLKAKSSKSQNCKNSSHSSWFIC